MEPQEFVTVAVAGYAASVSTVLAVHQLRSARPNLRIMMNYCILSPPVYGPNPLISLSAANAGKETTVLTSAGWRLPNGMDVIIPIPKSPRPFPHKLAPGDAHQMFMATSEIQESLRSEGLSGKVRMKPFYRDQIGRIHFGATRLWDAERESLLPAGLYRRIFPKRLRVGRGPSSST